MKKALIIFALLALLAAVVRFLMVWRDARPETDLRVLNGVEVNYILTPTRAGSLEVTLRPEFDVTSSENIIINSNDGLLELEPMSRGLTAEKLGSTAPDSFALDEGTTVLAISGQFFGQLDAAEYSRAVPLPSRGMHLAPSTNAGTVYLFGGEGRSSHLLYAVHRDGQLTILAELTDSIIAAADTQHAVYIATNREIYRVRGNKLELLIRLPENIGQLISLAAAADDKVLYFSSESRVYALRGLAAISIVNNAGGVLRIRKGKLYFWDPARKLLVTLTGVEEALVR